MPRRKSSFERVYLKTNEVARAVGLSARTLLRKLAVGELPEPSRDPHNNYRLWTVRDVEEITKILREQSQ